MQNTIMRTPFLRSIPARHGGVFKGIYFDTIVIAWVVFGHVDTKGLNKENPHMDLGLRGVHVKGKIILFVIV